MTPESVPKTSSPDYLEAKARIHDDHGQIMWAARLRELAQELRDQQAGQEKW